MAHSLDVHFIHGGAGWYVYLDSNDVPINQLNPATTLAEAVEIFAEYMNSPDIARVAE